MERKRESTKPDKVEVGVSVEISTKKPKKITEERGCTADSLLMDELIPPECRSKDYERLKEIFEAPNKDVRDIQIKRTYRRSIELTSPDVGQLFNTIMGGGKCCCPTQDRCECLRKRSSIFETVLPRKCNCKNRDCVAKDIADLQQAPELNKVTEERHSLEKETSTSEIPMTRGYKCKDRECLKEIPKGPEQQRKPSRGLEDLRKSVELRSKQTSTMEKLILQPYKCKDRECLKPGFPEKVLYQKPLAEESRKAKLGYKERPKERSSKETSTTDNGIPRGYICKDREYLKMKEENVLNDPESRKTSAPDNELSVEQNSKDALPLDQEMPSDDNHNDSECTKVKEEHISGEPEEEEAMEVNNVRKSKQTSTMDNVTPGGYICKDRECLKINEEKLTEKPENIRKTSSPDKICKDRSSQSIESHNSKKSIEKPLPKVEDNLGEEPIKQSSSLGSSKHSLTKQPKSSNAKPGQYRCKDRECLKAMKDKPGKISRTPSSDRKGSKNDLVPEIKQDVADKSAKQLLGNSNEMLPKTSESNNIKESVVTRPRETSTLGTGYRCKDRECLKSKNARISDISDQVNTGTHKVEEETSKNAESDNVNSNLDNQLPSEAAGEQPHKKSSVRSSKETLPVDIELNNARKSADKSSKQTSTLDNGILPNYRCKDRECLKTKDQIVSVKSEQQDEPQPRTPSSSSKSSKDAETQDDRKSSERKSIEEPSQTKVEEESSEIPKKPFASKIPVRTNSKDVDLDELKKSLERMSKQLSHLDTTRLHKCKCKADESLKSIVEVYSDIPEQEELPELSGGSVTQSSSSNSNSIQSCSTISAEADSSGSKVNIAESDSKDHQLQDEEILNGPKPWKCKCKPGDVSELKVENVPEQTATQDGKSRQSIEKQPSKSDSASQTSSKSIIPEAPTSTDLNGVTKSKEHSNPSLSLDDLKLPKCKCKADLLKSEVETVVKEQEPQNLQSASDSDQKIPEEPTITKDLDNVTTLEEQNSKSSLNLADLQLPKCKCTIESNLNEQEQEPQKHQSTSGSDQKVNEIPSLTTIPEETDSKLEDNALPKSQSSLEKSSKSGTPKESGSKDSKLNAPGVSAEGVGKRASKLDNVKPRACKCAEDDPLNPILEEASTKDEIKEELRSPRKSVEVESKPDSESIVTQTSSSSIPKESDKQESRKSLGAPTDGVVKTESIDSVTQTPPEGTNSKSPSKELISSNSSLKAPKSCKCKDRESLSSIAEEESPPLLQISIRQSSKSSSVQTVSTVSKESTSRDTYWSALGKSREMACTPDCGTDLLQKTSSQNMEPCVLGKSTELMCSPDCGDISTQTSKPDDVAEAPTTDSPKKSVDLMCSPDCGDEATQTPPSGDAEESSKPNTEETPVPQSDDLNKSVEPICSPDCGNKISQAPSINVPEEVSMQDTELMCSPTCGDTVTQTLPSIDASEITSTQNPQIKDVALMCAPDCGDKTAQTSSEKPVQNVALICSPDCGNIVTQTPSLGNVSKGTSIQEAPANEEAAVELVCAPDCGDTSIPTSSSIATDNISTEASDLKKDIEPEEHPLSVDKADFPVSKPDNDDMTCEVTLNVLISIKPPGNTSAPTKTNCNCSSSSPQNDAERQWNESPVPQVVEDAELNPPNPFLNNHVEQILHAQQTNKNFVFSKHYDFKQTRNNSQQNPFFNKPSEQSSHNEEEEKINITGENPFVNPIEQSLYLCKEDVHHNPFSGKTSYMKVEEKTIKSQQSLLLNTYSEQRSSVHVEINSKNPFFQSTSDDKNMSQRNPFLDGSSEQVLRIHPETVVEEGEQNHFLTNQFDRENQFRNLATLQTLHPQANSGTNYSPSKTFDMGIHHNQNKFPVKYVILEEPNGRNYVQFNTPPSCNHFGGRNTVSEPKWSEAPHRTTDETSGRSSTWDNRTRFTLKDLESELGVTRFTTDSNCQLEQPVVQGIVTHLTGLIPKGFSFFGETEKE